MGLRRGDGSNTAGLAMTPHPTERPSNRFPDIRWWVNLTLDVWNGDDGAGPV